MLPCLNRHDNFVRKKHLKETDVPVEAKLATDTTRLWREGNHGFGNAQKNPAEQEKLAEADAISHSSEGLENEEQIHSGTTHNPMDHVGGHMSTERDVALTNKPSPWNVQAKDNSRKSSNQEWRIYDDVKSVWIFNQCVTGTELPKLS
ncbi:hypothetical protein FGIG_11796 [Fasciola gigantica]|uniref:Uncharacterized protein n=1 Tax=Fasciola gigantica TaxID=46835 RepID=A0A504YEQ8_FASGI|nr:hypothetical protein FGIG_11796 [Fasciola gigantica]